jgi:hypothetical protein
MSPTAPPPPTRPPRPRLRFTLRLLLAALTLLCLAFGLWTHRAREQRRIVQRLYGGGLGEVVYDFEFDASEREKAKSPIPPWAINLLGIDFFHQVKAARTSNSDLFKELPRLSTLEDLFVQCDELSAKNWHRSLEFEASSTCILTPATLKR